MAAKAENLHLVFKTAFGVCAVLFSENPFRITSLLLPEKDHSALKAKAPSGRWGIPGKNAEVLSISGAVTEYFAGRCNRNLCPEWHRLETENLTPLETEVLRAAARIPYGRVRSYKEIAVQVNRPRAYRFIGSTMAKNPFPILIPCHRVVRSDLSVGNYGGGPEMKKKLIELEAENALK